MSPYGRRSRKFCGEGYLPLLRGEPRFPRSCWAVTERASRQISPRLASHQSPLTFMLWLTSQIIDEWEGLDSGRSRSGC